MLTEKFFPAILAEQVDMVLAINKRAKFDYQVLESFQAGLSMSGKLVKEIRQRRVQLTGNFVVYQKGRLEIIGLGNETVRENVPLLLQPREMKEIIGRTSEKGISCIVLNVKTVGRWIKAEVAIAKGKKQYHKKEAIKERDLDREMRREE